MTKDELLDALQEALTFENEGVKFYKDEAEKVKSMLAKTALLDLANMEVEHARRIKAAYDVIQKNGKLTGNEIGPSMTLPQALNGIFDRIKKDLEQLKKDRGENLVSDEDVMLAAANLEVRGLNMYQEKLEMATEKTIIQFFQWLVNEEKMHYEMLMKTKQYLTKPDTWFTVGDPDRGMPRV